MKLSLIAFVVAFCFSLIVAPMFINVLSRLKAGQNILSYVDKHSGKQGTPTIGGVIFLVGVLLAYIACGGYKYIFASVIICTMFGYALIGFLDDFLKIKLKHNEGLRPYQKALGQVGIAVLLACFVYISPLVGSEVVIPFSFDSINLGWFVIPFVIFVFVAVTNAVNLTDGLDGLAGGVSVAYLISFGVILSIYISKLTNLGVNADFINEITSVQTLTFALSGAILAFMCFNSYPAKVFMGDTGSLAIGGFIACSISVTKLYLYMPLIGLMFVLSCVSVVIQVCYFKLTHKRIFKMAPLHHHFELGGSNETKIVAIYIIVTIVLGVCTIAFSL